MPADTLTAGWPSLGELGDVAEEVALATDNLQALAEERYESLLAYYGKEPWLLPTHEELSQTTALVAKIESHLAICHDAVRVIAKVRDEAARGMERHGWGGRDDA